MKKLDLIGKRFGKLVVLEQGETRRTKGGSSYITWKCKCDCGNTVTVSGGNLRKGNTKSCGCELEKLRKERKFISLVGNKFGKLTVIERTENQYTKSGVPVVAYRCRCDCGNEVIVRAGNLRSGHTSSCGCNSSRNYIGENNKKHGMSNKRIHVIWQRINERCNNKNADNYQYYGERGIKVCKEWQGINGAENFIKWALENGYKEKLTIERKDVNGDYCPDNCTWVTQKEQCNNKRNNIMISYKGKTQTLTQWCEEFNLNYQRVRERIKNGWDFESAAFTPVHSIRHKKDFR